MRGKRKLRPLALQAEDELMTMKEVCAFFGGVSNPINRSTLYRGIKEGRFPAQIKIGLNTSRWRRKDCEDALRRMELGVTKDNFIQEWRIARGFKTQSEFARASGIERATICRLESGALPWRKHWLEKLAAALDCTPADLLRPPSYG
jgi:predicted DNA-binding transcriptional regulator AlpA/DNA-binding Xre family transcriptional regulator